MFELNVFLRDKLIGRSTFATEEVRIGRSVDNEVQIDNLALSRYHASIEDMGGVHVLKDFGSNNGTFVNGERVAGRRGLNDGDVITVGKFSLVFRGDRAPAASADVRDAASYAVAGETIVTKVTAESRERPCPYVAFLEAMVATKTEPPRTYPLVKDLFVIGSAQGSDLLLDPKACPPRVAAILRGWRGFQLLALAPGLVRNRAPVEHRADLNRNDELTFGTVSFRYLVGRTDAGVT